jgi:hypothetical protein
MNVSSNGWRHTGEHVDFPPDMTMSHDRCERLAGIVPSWLAARQLASGWWAHDHSLHPSGTACRSVLPRAGDMIRTGISLRVVVMSDGSASGNDARVALGRAAKLKGILKGRGRQFPVILLMIVVLSIAMIYSLVTTVMM